MPKKKVSQKKAVSRNLKKNNKKSLASRIKWEESYTSLLIGAVVVLLVIIGTIFFIKLNKKTQTSSVQYKPSIETVTQKPEVTPETKEGKVAAQIYVVQKGDNLWMISEKIYKSGYNWVDIVKANNLTDPSVIHVGNKLAIPSVAPKVVTAIGVGTTASSGNAISKDTYTVEKGDYLWEIAVRAYGDGFAWTKIAKANNLENPSLIFSGNVLKIPR